MIKLRSQRKEKVVMILFKNKIYKNLNKNPKCFNDKNLEIKIFIKRHIFFYTYDYICNSNKNK